MDGLLSQRFPRSRVRVKRIARPSTLLAMPDHSSFNASRGTKDATDGSHPHVVTMHVRAPPHAAYAKHTEKKRKRSSRTEGEGVPSERKKKKHRHDTPEQTAEAPPTKGAAISSSGVDRHEKKKRKQRSSAQVAETYPRDAAYSPEENYETNSKETKESKQREALGNVVPSVRPSLSDGTPPATDSQPKRKSKKSKKHRLHEGDAGIASAITVASPSSTPQIATVNLDPLPPTDSTLQPTIEQLAEYDNPEDLLRAVSRPKATSSSTATSSKGNAAARKGAGAGAQTGSRTRPSKLAFTRLESSLVPVPSGADDSETVPLKWLSAGEMKKVCEERGVSCFRCRGIVELLSYYRANNMIGIKLKQGKFTQLEGMSVAQALAGYRVVCDIIYFPSAPRNIHYTNRPTTYRKTRWSSLYMQNEDKKLFSVSNSGNISVSSLIASSEATAWIVLIA